MNDAEDSAAPRPDPADPAVGAAAGPAVEERPSVEDKPKAGPRREPEAVPSAATRTAAVVRALSLLAAAAHYAHRVIDSAALSAEDWRDAELARVMAELREAGERIEEILP